MARAASAPTTSSRHEQPETTISAIATSTHATHIQQRLLRVVVCAQKVKGHIRLFPTWPCRRVFRVVGAGNIRSGTHCAPFALLLTRLKETSDSARETR